MKEFEYRLKRLFVFSHGLEEMQHRYPIDDLYRLLLDEVVELEIAYEDCNIGGDIMTETYTTLQIPFTDEEVQFIDDYAAQNAETREELLHRMFQKVVTDIRSEMK